MKFEVAYFRPTTFGDPSKTRLRTLRALRQRRHSHEKEYLTFQDYVFRFLILRRGTVALPVHIHTAVGIGDYFNLTQSNVMNLESMLRDPRYSATTFVLIHGGFPWKGSAVAGGDEECLSGFIVYGDDALSVGV